MMNLGLKGLTHLGRRAGKIDEHPTGVHDVHLKAVRFQPARQSIKVLLRYAESGSEFLRGNPVVKVGRARGVQLVQELLKSLLLLWRALELQEHVLEREAVGNPSTVVLEPRFRMRVAKKRDAFRFFDILGDTWAALPI